MKTGYELLNPFVGTVVDDHVVKEPGYKSFFETINYHIKSIIFY
jgi:hypothetical protein